MAYQNDGNGEANQLKVSNDFSDDNPLNGSNRTSTEFDGKFELYFSLHCLFAYQYKYMFH